MTRMIVIGVLSAVTLIDGPPTVAGRVVADETGDPIVNARVRIVGTGHSGPFAVTDGEGRFTIALRQAGVYTLAAMKSGYVKSERVVRDSNDTIELRMPRAAVVSGRVIDRLGDPVVDASVAVEQVVGSTGRRTMVASAISDDNGEFRIGGLAAGQTGGVSFTIGVGLVSVPPEAASNTASIRGRVATPDGRPLRRATVRLFGQSVPFQTTTSDAEGVFEFAGLAAGRYRVAAAKGGYLPPPASEIVLLLPALGGGPLVEVTDGQTKNGVTVTLAKLGTLSGLVFDELGEPIENASVQLLRVRFERGRRRLVPFGSARSTDDRGHYRLFNIAPGQYVVAASVGALESADLPGYARTFFPGTAETGSAQFVSVGVTDEVSGIDFSMGPTRTAIVAGTVVDGTGTPTRPGRLQLRAAAASVASAEMNARIGPHGEFEFSNVPPGQYVIFADRGRKGPSIEGEFAAVPVTVTGDDLTGLTVQMSSGSSIAGRVTFESIEGSRLPRPETIGFAPLPVDPDFAPVNVAEAQIARDFTFTMSGVNGLRRLTPTRLPAGWALRAVRVNGIDATDQPLPFGRANQSLSDVEVVLTDRVNEIRGVVSDSNGQSVAIAPVIVMPVDGDRRYFGARNLQVTHTRPDGTFAAVGLSAGAYYVVALASLPTDGDGAWQDPSFLEALSSSATTVTVGEGDKQIVTLRITGDRR